MSFEQIHTYMYQRVHEYFMLWASESVEYCISVIFSMHVYGEHTHVCHAGSLIDMWLECSPIISLYTHNTNPKKNGSLIPECVYFYFAAADIYLPIDGI